MSIISSESLFHFTNELQSIKDILKSKAFIPSYCLERNPTLPNQFLRIPMVSFCDIPLTQASNVSSYGNYCLGLSKEWGIKKGLTPVFYINKNGLIFKRFKSSELSSKILKNINIYTELHNKIDSNNAQVPILPNFINDTLESASLNIFQNFKEYSGKLKRRGMSTIENYKFYDEREWRYIPDIRTTDIDSCPNIINANGWKKNFRKQYFRKPHFKKWKKYHLNFRYEDINYVIIKSEEEKAEIINYLTALRISNLPIFLSNLTSFEKIKKNH